MKGTVLHFMGALARFLGSPRRLAAFGRWLWAFAVAFLISNAQTLVWTLWLPRSEWRPDFLVYGVRGLGRGEIVLLAQIITLTPGTTAVEVSEDGTELLLHVLDARDPEAVRAGIDRDLREPMLAFTR